MASWFRCSARPAAAKALLNMLSGILPVSGGKIYFDDQDANIHAAGKARHWPRLPELRALSAHDGHGQHLFPLETQRVPKAERIERANEIAKFVHVDMLMNRKP